MTVRQLAVRFDEEHIAVRCKPGSQGNYRNALYKYIVPTFGDLGIDEVTRGEVGRLHASLKDKPASANMMLCVLSCMYNKAIHDWELTRIPNPALRIRKFRVEPVERFLTSEERQILDAELERCLAIPHGFKDRMEPAAVWAIRLLSLTGMRRDEVLGLQWPMVDWRSSCLRLPDSKTGKKVVLVSSPVIALLREIYEHLGRPRTGLVIRSRSNTKITSLNVTWSKLRERLGMPDLRLHDLRHSAASDAIMSGVPLQVVGKMLGHKNWQTTQRYAHIADHVVQEAVERTGLAILRATRPA